MYHNDGLLCALVSALKDLDIKNPLVVVSILLTLRNTHLQELLLDRRCRHALACGMISNDSALSAHTKCWLGNGQIT
jgi:hypothetical protein